jgi:hypothetical protein
MELLALGIAGIIAIWFFGFDTPIKEVAKMANREISLQNGQHIKSTVVALKTLDLTAESVDEAKETMKLIKGFDV